MTSNDVWFIIQSIGCFLSGMAILFLFFDFIARRRSLFSASYSEKVERTFSYIKRLDSFRHIHFLNIYNYKKISKAILGKGKGDLSLKLYDVDPTGRVVMVGMSEGRETLRKNLVELFNFLKEMSLLLRDVEKHRLVDKTLLFESFERYQINLNEFFLAAQDFLSNKEKSLSESYGLYGDFSRRDLLELKKALKEVGFDFIK